MSTLWVKSAGVVWEELDKDALLVNPEARASWLLNPTASYVWKHCNGATGLKNLALALARKGGAEARRIERELSAFCASLERAGLLRVAAVPCGLNAQVAAFAGEYSTPSMSSLSLGAGPRRRPSPRGNSGPG